MPGSERTGDWRSLLADRARRTQLATSATIVALSLLVLRLVGVLDDTSAWVQVVLYVALVLAVAFLLVMAVLDLKEQRARRGPQSLVRLRPPDADDAPPTVSRSGRCTQGHGAEAPRSPNAGSGRTAPCLLEYWKCQTMPG